MNNIIETKATTSHTATCSAGPAQAVNPVEKTLGSNGAANTKTSDIKAMPDEDLAAAIQSGHRQIETEIHTARRHASAALMGALRAGEYLLEARRRFKSDGWLKWLAEHCPELPTSSAYRYLGLAKKFPHVGNAQEIKSLRQAYLALGILPEEPKKKKKAPDLDKVLLSSGPDLVARVQSMQQVVDAELGQADVAALEASVRLGLKQEIAALVAKLNGILERIGQTDAPEMASPVATAAGKEEK